MIGFNTINHFPFMEFLLNIFMVLLVAESLNYLISYITDDILVCILLASTILGFNSLSNGGYMGYNELPLIWKGYYYINFNSYCF